METAVMREHPDTRAIVVYWHKDALPAYRWEEYPDEFQARAAYPQYEWQAPDDDADRDVVCVATLP